MKNGVLLCLMMFCLCGCAGVSITSISQQDAKDLHKPNSGRSGYVVYEPMVVVELSRKDVCVKKDDKDNCTQTETRCSAGAPFILPDYSKPYLIDVRSGFGKAGTDVTINDGWRLGNVKDNSDNTAVLGTVERLMGGLLSLKSRAVDTTNKGCEEGLYQVTISDSGDNTRLVPLKLYIDKNKSLAE